MLEKSVSELGDEPHEGRPPLDSTETREAARRVIQSDRITRLQILDYLWRLKRTGEHHGYASDEDVREASSGMHVGLAMKGVLPKNLNRGTIITTFDDSIISEVTQITDMKLKRAAFGEFPKDGDKIHVVSGLYDSPGEIAKLTEATISLKLEKPIPYYPDIRFTLLDLNKKPSILGSKL